MKGFQSATLTKVNIACGRPGVSETQNNSLGPFQTWCADTSLNITFFWYPRTNLGTVPGHGHYPEQVFISARCIYFLKGC